MTELSPREILRYGRHLVMPEVTAAGQAKLKAARVLCVGAGGLGSPVSLYLAAAGIGTLGVVEYDTVDLSNIQRQILYVTADVGRPKLEAAAARLAALNTDIVVVRHDTRLTSDNVMDVVADYDIVVDGTDNFPTRYLVNDACVLAGKPNVYGSIFRFEGQVSVFDATRGPCYRCLFPEPPPPGAVPSCAEGGVLGVLPGIIGTLQALEVLKRVLELGDDLVGRLVLFDALAFEFRELRIRRDPDCVVCGHSPSITAPIDYDAFCSGPAQPADAREPGRIGVREFADLRERDADVELLDVRNPYETDIAAIPDAILIPLDQLPRRLGELDPSRRYVVTCHHGPRAVRACELLADAGFERLEVLEGGLDAWSIEVDPSVPRYG
ncbi:MAG TPA: molybdopterin-synthase adenylyltransferase MoeB [Woeseiaceae bacterium]|nr:molybdopterin-synthase adenylyltransferase MoeB [Woeseiaceae bacterium]